MLLGGEPLDGPVAVKSERHESDEGVLLELSHDGYGERFNLRHERRIFLNSAGNDLRGEDRISLLDPEVAAEEESDVAVRFHLHPELRARQEDEGDQVVLFLPRGDTWRFRALGGVLTLEDSIYLGRGAQVTPCRQIVLRASAEVSAGEPITFKWKFFRPTSR